MIASLAMYSFPDTRAATERFWAAIRLRLRASGIAAPEGLTHGKAAYWAAWEAPDLVLSQTCGFPLRARLHLSVSLVGTPDYGVEGCPPGYYRSVVIVSAQDPAPDLAALRGDRFAYNDTLSQSGWAAPHVFARSLGLLLRPAVCTGGHQISAQAVAEGAADLAAIDCVTWSLLQRNEPALTSRLRVLALTDPTPGLPYISARDADLPTLFAAVSEAIASLSSNDRDTLFLRGLVDIPMASYLAVESPVPDNQSARTT